VTTSRVCKAGGGYSKRVGNTKRVTLCRVVVLTRCWICVQGVVRLMLISCYIPGSRQHHKTMGFFNNLGNQAAGRARTRRARAR